MPLIDHSLLTSRGLAVLRRQALAIVETGLKAADGGRAVRDAVKVVDGGIDIEGRFHPIPPDGRLFILGGGKATLPVAQALEEILGDRIEAGTVVLRRGEQAVLDHLEVLHADHPLPSPDSVAAAQRISDLAAEAGEGDLVITCFTGGRSALLSLPPDQVDFADKHRLNEVLLASGMPISGINTVRKHVSRIKGGRLAERIGPARIVNLTISDVAGDPLDVLADLTTQDTSTAADALDLLDAHGLTDRLPESTVAHLRSEAAESPDLSGAGIDTVMLVNGAKVCDEMAAAARELGLDPVVVSTSLEGEATAIGRQVASLARGNGENGPHAPYPPGTVLIGCGGEGTVNLGEASFGSGGPNQEAALAAALALNGQPVAAVFLDTDGSDGGTEVAGAICDGETVRRAHELGLDLEGALASHTSTRPFEGLGDVIETGPTGTNVNDLFVAVIGE